MSDVIKCPKCGDEDLKLRTRPNEKVDVRAFCPGCGGEFSIEELARHLYDQRLKARGKVGEPRKN